MPIRASNRGAAGNNDDGDGADAAPKKKPFVIKISTE